MEKKNNNDNYNNNKYEKKADRGVWRSGGAGCEVPTYIII